MGVPERGTGRGPRTADQIGQSPGTWLLIRMATGAPVRNTRKAPQGCCRRPRRGPGTARRGPVWLRRAARQEDGVSPRARRCDCGGRSPPRGRRWPSRRPAGCPWPIPGLLQTPGYARAMHEADIPRLTQKRIDELVEVRMMRQRLLSRDPALSFWVVLDEAVLHRLVGGPQVMRAQLERLIEVTNLPNVTMQVIPYSAGAHPAMDSTFRMLDFAGLVPSLVYVEGLVGRIYVESPHDIARYQQVFEYLCTVALNPQESIKLVERVSAKRKSMSISTAQDGST